MFRMLLRTSVFTEQKRLISVSCCCCGRKTRVPYDRRIAHQLSGRDVSEHKPGGTKELRERIGRAAWMPQPPGYIDAHGKFVYAKEMVPEFVVPDLTNFKLKPYVTYKAPEVTQSEFTPRDLFSAVYGRRVVRDFQDGRLTAEDLGDVEKLLAKDTSSGKS